MGSGGVVEGSARITAGRISFPGEGGRPPRWDGQPRPQDQPPRAPPTAKHLSGSVQTDGGEGSLSPWRSSPGLEVSCPVLACTWMLSGVLGCPSWGRWRGAWPKGGRHHCMSLPPKESFAGRQGMVPEDLGFLLPPRCTQAGSPTRRLAGGRRRVGPGQVLQGEVGW